MAYTISTLKTELQAAVGHGTSIAQITAINNLIDRAARELLADLDPLETVRISEITTAIFDQVYDYTCPSDLKGDRIIDIRPQVNRQTSDLFYQKYNAEFDRTKADMWLWEKPKFTIQWNTYARTLRIAKSLTNPALINAASSITANGTWAAGGNATNLAQDTLYYVSGGASLRFDVTAGGAGSTAYLENSTMTAVDLSTHKNVSTLFCWVYIPDATIVTNFILRWGSSTANYWSRTVTTDWNSVAFQTGWNLLGFAWNGATETGSVTNTAINYLRLTMTYNGTADTDIRFNSFTSNLGVIYEIEYYSKFLFRDTTTGAFQETVTADTNLVNLDTDSYNVFFNLVAYYAAQQIQGNNSSYDANFFKGEYEKAKSRYVKKVRSQVLQPQSTYYSTDQRRITTIRYT